MCNVKYNLTDFLDDIQVNVKYLIWRVTNVQYILYSNVGYDCAYNLRRLKNIHTFYFASDLLYLT